MVHRQTTPEAPFALLQVYCLLDEFIIGGEIQETSKKVRGQDGLH